MFLFWVVGTASTVVDFGGFLLLTWLGLWEWVASAISFMASFVVNYLGNRDLVFRAGSVPGAMRRYVVLVIFNWVVSTGMVALFVELGWAGWIAKLVSIVVIGVFNFITLRAWVFKKRD
jgi:putative flippase GtrA